MAIFVCFWTGRFHKFFPDNYRAQNIEKSLFFQMKSIFTLILKYYTFFKSMTIFYQIYNVFVNLIAEYTHSEL